jgi:hypothetical protein
MDKKRGRIGLFFLHYSYKLKYILRYSIQGWGIALAFFLREICQVIDGI